MDTQIILYAVLAVLAFGAIYLLKWIGKKWKIDTSALESAFKALGVSLTTNLKKEVTQYQAEIEGKIKRILASAPDGLTQSKLVTSVIADYKAEGTKAPETIIIKAVLLLMVNAGTVKTTTKGNITIYLI